MRGGNDEYLIGVVEDADAPAFLVSADIVEITKAAAITDGEKYRKQVSQVTDEGRLWEVMRKVANKETLALADLEALDPDKSEPGVNYTKSFTEMINEYV